MTEPDDAAQPRGPTTLADEKQLLARLRGSVKGLRQRIVLLGLGRLQLGLIGPTFADLGFELAGVSLRDPAVARRVADHRYYRVITDPPYGGQDVEVVSAHHFDLSDPSSTESQAAIAAAAEARIINCGLGVSPQSLAAASEFLLAVERYRRTSAIIDTLFITSSDNPVGRTFAVDLVQSKLQAATFALEEDERVALWNDMAYHVKFLPTLADRVCSTLQVPADPKRPASVIAEEFGELSFNRSLLGLQRLASRDSERLGAIRLWDDLEVARQRKLYTLSMAHAVTAYVGSFDSGPRTYVADALQSSVVRSHVERALEDVTSALVAKSGGAESEWFDYARTVLRRIGDERLQDPLMRVAREVPRKLGRDDRLLGPLLLVLRTSFNLSVPLVAGVVYALVYAYVLASHDANEEPDPSSFSMAAELRAHGVRSVLRDVCALDLDDETESYVADVIQREFQSLIPG